VRAALAELLGRVTVEQRADGQVWAIAETQPAAMVIAAGGLKMGSVAGGGLRAQLHVRIV